MNTPRKSPSQQRSWFTYRTILESAARVFDREGMSATTNRIAEDSGFSVGSLYQYFPNKQAILHELAMRHIDRAEAAFAAVLEHLEITDSDLEATVTHLVNVAVQQNRPLVRLHQLLRDHAPRTPELEQRFGRLVEMIVDGLVGHLERPDGDCATLRLRVRLAVVALDSQIHQIVLDADTPEEQDRRTALSVDQMIRMLSPSAG